MKQANQHTPDLWKNSTNPFRYRLNKLRTNLGLSIDDLSKELKIFKIDMIQFESGEKEPSISQLKRIATFFSVTVDQLIGFKL